MLTKRSNRLKALLSGKLGFAAEVSHIWWGVSVENRKHGMPRIEHLRESPARVRFLSIEPLLEDLAKFSLETIHWVIVGGESGHGARPMNEEWVTGVKTQCAKSKVPFFFKQWGGRQKSKTGRMLEGRTYDEMPVESPLYSIQIPSSKLENRAI